MLHACVCTTEETVGWSTLLGCSAEPRCTSETEMVDGGGPLSVRGDIECLLEGVMNRIPGLYRHRSIETHDQDSEQSELVIWIKSDGTATSVRRDSAAYAVSDDASSLEWVSVEYDQHPVQCELGRRGDNDDRRAYYEGCLQMLGAHNLNPNAHRLLLERCLHVDGIGVGGFVSWFTECEPTEARCE